ncbi:MAG: type II toxin-antitoxin system RelE/ParE family toxin [Deltaproteobacteria bacterium]|nr:type II toxin-antitoxin system RelE/ParE family toxin [Deltaproteobacteria bacterium]
MPWVIELYREGARVPVEELLNDLDPLGRDRVTAKIDLLGEMGTRLGPPHVKHLQGKLWELRVTGRRQIRILYFIASGRRIVLLHGFVKKTQVIPRRKWGQACVLT